MNGRSRIVEQLTELARVTSNAFERAELRRKRRVRALKRVLKIAATLWFVTAVIVITLIATGQLFGPTGAENLLPTLLGLIATWALILFAFRKRKVAPAALASGDGDLGQLVAHTSDWLDQQRDALPAAAKGKLDSIQLRLEALGPQVRGLPPGQPAGAEVRRLVGEELPELVNVWAKVPVALKRQPTVGGETPDRHLSEGLGIVDEELARMHARLAQNDLDALATQQRYLDAKYKRRGKLE